MKDWLNYLWFASMLFWLGTMIAEPIRRKRYREKMTKDITKGLLHRVVLIEGRCPKCDGRIPDELMTPEDLKRKDSVAIQ